MKKIGFLSFGHWTPSSQTRSAADTLLQSIDLAVAAEELGADGAYFRVHHFARQLASPFPLLAAAGAKTSRIEIGTAVIDMRYENPFYMAEDAGAADLIAGQRLQLGISRGSPEQVIDGWRYFGYQPAEGQNDADMGRRHAEVFFDLLRGEGFAQPNPRPMFPNPPGLLRLEPHSDGLRDRIWWGASSNATAIWAAKVGMNLQSSTLKNDETGEAFHVQQAAQIRAYRAAWKEAGHAREPRVSVSRSIFALMDDRDRSYFGRGREDDDQIGFIDERTRAIFGRSYSSYRRYVLEWRLSVHRLLDRRKHRRDAQSCRGKSRGRDRQNNRDPRSWQAGEQQGRAFGLSRHAFRYPRERLKAQAAGSISRRDDRRQADRCVRREVGSIRHKPGVLHATGLPRRLTPFAQLFSRRRELRPPSRKERRS
jgi:alkanesulfonate monooxygenase SsuD/methylene tetrahydromethanopterin reductase-like flavin-dependent oxidoreductase (luciferase family)